MHNYSSTPTIVFINQHHSYIYIYIYIYITYYQNPHFQVVLSKAYMYTHTINNSFKIQHLKPQRNKIEALFKDRLQIEMSPTAE